jgi:hypothetical protein
MLDDVKYNKRIIRPVMNSYSLRGLIACGLLLQVAFSLKAFEKRSAFDIPLPYLCLSLNSDSTLDEVFVSFGHDLEGWGISPINDRYVNNSSSVHKESVYKELPEYAQLLSPFETKVLDRVCESFIATLQTYENDLANSRWDRLRYLDPYFNSFFRGFFHLYNAALKATDLLPPVVYIDDSLLTSLSDSAKTDQRIAMWQHTPDHSIKLRIAAKELIFQIKQWQKKELRNVKRDVWEDKSWDFLKAYELFIRLYFNIPASPTKR